jgi:redox-sensitive bicupin YhaK (pirin superfamily)
MPAGKTFTHKTTKGHTAFIYLYSGNCITDNTIIDKDTAVLFDDGEIISVSTKDKEAKFILLTGKPLNEPISWGGPIVMNTEEELQQAFEELDEGTFIR